MPSQAQTELFNRVFEGHQNGIDPTEYDAERRNTLEEQGRTGFWLENYNNDNPRATARIYEAGKQIGRLLFMKDQRYLDGAFVELRTGELKIETSATHAAHVIDSVIKRIASR